MSACSPCSKSTLPSFSLVDDQNGLNNYAEAILTEQDRFKNHSKDWESSLSIDHPSIQVVSSVVKYYNVSYIQGGFFNWSALKMTKCQTLRKF